MRVAATKNDVLVMVGDGICNVTSLLDLEIYCIPPKSSPSPLTMEDLEQYQDQPQVIVSVKVIHKVIVSVKVIHEVIVSF